MQQAEGYTEAADIWSVGITLYVRASTSAGGLEH